MRRACLCWNEVEHLQVAVAAVLSAMSKVEEAKCHGVDHKECKCTHDAWLSECKNVDIRTTLGQRMMDGTWRSKLRARSLRCCAR